jgi:hypothetical protein
MAVAVAVALAEAVLVSPRRAAAAEVVERP